MAETNVSSSDLYEGLRTLERPEATVPETRIVNAQEAQNLVQRFIWNDQTRSRKRSMVKGLVDGNPPYRASKLKEAGRADACNVNWRIPSSYLDAAQGAFYDIFSEAPSYSTVLLDYGNADEQATWSRTVTERFYDLQMSDTSFDYNMQISQYEMVLFGLGPLLFEDGVDWRFRSAQCNDLKVPENARSNVDRWEVAVVIITYLPHELFDFIRNEKAAERVGWNVAETRKAIMEAHPKTQQGGLYLDWEWHQQQLKNGSYGYSLDAKSIVVGHVYYREFPQNEETEGRISHGIVMANNFQDGTTDFLFRRIGRFRRWQQVIHPMYYDHGGGGQHHSVTGMGVKMYAAMEYQNRLLCNLADKAFAPKILLRPTTSNDKQRFNLITLGDYGVMPPGFDLQQAGIAGLLNDGLAFNRELASTMASNLSQYRQNLQEKAGNPVTKGEIDWRASEQARLGKTQLNRYYEQLDALYLEQYKRATNPGLTVNSPGGKAALEFQQACVRAGVPREALRRIKSVSATRIIGQGSMYMRQQSLEFLLGMLSMLPESGRDNLIQDVIASRSGQFMVERYYPSREKQTRPTDQHAVAWGQVADMKIGVPAVVTESQNPVIFGQVFLQAGAQAAASLQQGGDPAQVATFLDLIGSAAAAHIKRMSQDPTRKQVVELLGKQWQELAKIADQIKKHIQTTIEERNKAQAQAQKADGQDESEYQSTMVKAQREMELKEAKTTHGMKLKEMKTRQDIALKDAKTAQEIMRKRDGNG